MSINSGFDYKVKKGDYIMCKINPRVDFAFKLIFGSEQNKDILISLLNSILEDYQERPIASIEILNPFGSKEHERDKLTILDIRARDDKGEFYNIEMHCETFADKPDSNIRVKQQVVKHLCNI